MKLNILPVTGGLAPGGTEKLKRDSFDGQYCLGAEIKIQKD